MKKHLYILIEAILSMFVLILIVGLCFIEFDIVIVALAPIGSLYFIYKILMGVKLFVDIIEGPKEKYSIFMGNLGAEHLDFFWKISFSNIYFDDELLTKNYLLFDDGYCGDLHQEDRIRVVYYKRSRIVLQIYNYES